MRFEYKTTYYPTGSVSITSGEFDSEVDFLRYLNYWNLKAKGMYLFTTDYHFPAGPSAIDIDNMTLVYSGKREARKVYEDDGWWTSLGAITADYISVAEFLDHIVEFKNTMSTELEPHYYRSLFKRLNVIYTTVNVDDPDFLTATEQFTDIVIEYKSFMESKEYNT